MTEESIADSVRKCLEKFSLLENVESPLVTDSDRKSVLDIAEEVARFKIWSGNIGAHSTGRRSLQYRLRDASHLQKQVISLLDELSDLLADAYAIAIGEQIPWDHVEDDGRMGFDSKSESDDDVPATEMSQIAQNVSDVINCLLRLSVAIRNPAPHDCFATFVSIDASHYEPFDIEHVRSKFSEIEPFLADRLGRAISRRRQYFKYRESHHLKLSQGLHCQEPNDAPSTVASSLPQRAKAAGFNMDAVDEDEASDSGVTQTSFASSHSEDDKLRVPPLPREAENGPFECPFCYTMIIASSLLSWKRHVLADLRPYVCLSKDCTASEMEFMRRREWILHEVQNHWRMYRCPCSCGMVFPTKAQCRDHVSKNHAGAFPKDQVNSIIDLGARPIKVEDGIPCPLCKEPLHSIKEYRRHAGRHQEQLALFALPSIGNDREEEQLEDDAFDEHESASSGSVRIGILKVQDDDDDLAEEDDNVPPKPPQGEKDDDLFVNEAIPRKYLLKEPDAISEEALPHEGKKEQEAPSGAGWKFFDPKALGIGKGKVEIRGESEDFVIVRQAFKQEEIQWLTSTTRDETTGYTGDRSQCNHHRFRPASGDAVLVAYLDNGRNPELSRVTGRESLPFDAERDYRQIKSILEDKTLKPLTLSYIPMYQEERITKKDLLTGEWNREDAKYESALEELKVETDARKSSGSTRIAEESQARLQEIRKQSRDHEERSQLKRGESGPGEEDYENDYHEL
ncbi:unnamed protein product [Fusarium equiseti]|uniref:C2H2-type domain-containing protein n=1 Tax=Fusarium equiseti TaxID=61235 RepID=A0A8J2NCF9_FUSEQ|nr:unnamed protein product [Fusarium equiseti]